jgi:phage terminase large subunit
MKVQFAEDVGHLLFRPAPYKVMYGGRGGMKSWSAARALLILSRRRKLRILCCREIQKSIRDSVHKLLADQIGLLGMNGFVVKNTTIDNLLTSSEFIFAGLRHDINEIKSMEGIDICWVEEAHMVSKSSWTTLLPTIRKPAPFGPFGKGSEIWVTFNPELDTDYTYAYWVTDPPTGTMSLEVNWADNPWFPEVLDHQRLDMERKDPIGYATVWGGKPRAVIEGAIYAREIQLAVEQKRIARFPHMLDRKVNCYFDLGRRDMTAIWFVQQVGLDYYLIDFYQNSGYGLDHYLQVIAGKKYTIGEVWLPHDAYSSGGLSTPKTVARQFKESGYEGRVRRVKHLGASAVSNGINATRALFPRMYFDAEKCADGLQALRHYQFAVHPDTGERTVNPKDDWSTHAADSLRYFAVAQRDGEEREGVAPVETEWQYERMEHQQGWMRV